MVKAEKRQRRCAVYSGSSPALSACRGIVFACGSAAGG